MACRRCVQDPALAGAVHHHEPEDKVDDSDMLLASTRAAPRKNRVFTCVTLLRTCRCALPLCVCVCERERERERLMRVRREGREGGRE
jgi:hypothetical protein